MKRLTNDEIQNNIFEIMVYFDKVCRENNLKYSLSGGTCLGAVRHKGFIPWDNDADVIMLRDDYNKFISIMEKDNSKFKLFTYKNNPTYYYPFAKLINTSTVLIENIAKKGKDIKDMGVYLDIFPLDSVPEDKDECKKFLKQCHFKTKIFLAPYSKGTNFIKSVLKAIVSPFVNREKAMDKFEKFCSKYPKDGKMVAWCCWQGFAFPRKCIENLIEADFCGHKFYIPKDYDEMLTLQYGDYMTPPPPEKRLVHNIEAYKKD